MAGYRLTEEADQDLAEILRFGVSQFGLEQAEDYYDRLVDRLSAIAESPLMYQAVDHIRPGYRRSVFGVHSIYYIVKREAIVIVRILKKQDPRNAL